MVKEALIKLGRTVHVIAFSHVQAFNVDGMTVLHYLYKYIHCKDEWILLDEFPNNNIDSDGHLQKMQFMGCKFVLFGDMFQLPPILDKHRLELWSTLDKSNFMHNLTNGLRIELNKFRRGTDRSHFEFVRSIKQYVHTNDVEKALALAKENYPKDCPPEHCDLILTTTNKTRIRVNELLNEYHSQFHNNILELECKSNNGGQNMKIWKGIILQSAVTTYKNKKSQTNNSTRLRNACRYIVHDFDDDAIYIQQIDDKGQTQYINDTGETIIYSDIFDIELKEVCTNLRLSYASTYDSIQSATCYGNIGLYETEKSNFTVRKLIVGLGRAQISSQISFG